MDVAAARAVAQAAGPAPSAARPAVSLATPGVFGARASGLTLAVPHGKPVIDPAEQRMAYFPAEPARFVGRAEAMARASAALAPGSRRTAVLLHGMAGAGKSACALELAYRHADAFAALAFWQAPTREEEWASALPDFANRLDIQLGDYGFTMAGHIGTAAALAAFLPRLRQVMEASGVLLVLDNLETLLTPEGGWRDPGWGQLISALADHEGESRLILTSRIAPSGLDVCEPGGQPRLVTLPVHALSLEEAVALARELDNLRGLLHADASPIRAASSTEADHNRVRQVLRVVQGHPKLMELADAAAADRDRLDAQLTAAEEAAAGQGLEAFFQDGTSTLEPGEFLHTLTAWTATALGVLSAAARLMAEFVACLEDSDRLSYVIEATWGELWQRLGRPGDPPSPGPLLEALTIAALAEPEAVPATGAGDQPAPAVYRIHPGVAAAIAAAAGTSIRAAVDTVLGVFWKATADWAREGEAGEDTGLLVRAGLAAAPYLLRLEEWDVAGRLLERAIGRDKSPRVVQTALPGLRHIAEATGDPVDSAVLGRALRTTNPSEAERLVREALRRLVASDNFMAASAVAGDLIDHLMAVGRLDEALEVAEQKAEYTRRAGLGSWTQLLDRGRRLQILSLMGAHEQVLAETAELREQMAALPDRPGGDEVVYPWNIRETIVDTGHSSALATGDWQQCLELNAEITASMRRRGAGIHEITRAQFNDVAPLIRLGRLAEAGRLLADCQRVFEDHADTAMLALVFNGRANLENALGHRQAAVDLERTALRLRYARPEPASIAVGHHNLAIYQWELGTDRAGQRAHRLAAALIYRLAGMTHNLAAAMHALAVELPEDGGSTATLPSTVAEVVATAELTEGVQLGALLAALEPDPQAVENALAEILAPPPRRRPRTASPT